MKRRALMMAFALAAAAGCADQPPQRDDTRDRISAEMDKAVKERAKAATPNAVGQALLPPLVVEMPRADAQPLDQRTDVKKGRQ